jgi:mRNA-degrading endonuclease RelE of RelBE toxin-antitoxin system
LSKESLAKQVYDLKVFFEINWFSYKVFENYNIIQIKKDYFRVKFIPYRVILKIIDNEIIFLDLFKRKWKNDYKKYN